MEVRAHGRVAAGGGEGVAQLTPQAAIGGADDKSVPARAGQRGDPRGGQGGKRGAGALNADQDPGSRRDRRSVPGHGGRQRRGRDREDDEVVAGQLAPARPDEVDFDPGAGERGGEAGALAAGGDDRGAAQGRQAAPATPIAASHRARRDR